MMIEVFFIEIHNFYQNVVMELIELIFYEGIAAFLIMLLLRIFLCYLRGVIRVLLIIIIIVIIIIIIMAIFMIE
jgi:hypothetical protein